MAVIRVDVAALRKQAAATEGKISELRSLNSRLQQLIVRIGDSWEGEASTAYRNLLLRYAKKAEEMGLLLEEFKKYAINAADQFETEDRIEANLIRNSF